MPDPSPATDDRDQLQSAVTRSRLIQLGSRFAFPIPDALMAIILALAATVDFLTPEQLARWPAGFLDARMDLLFALMVEGGFLLTQGTLVDIATRLRKRPPIWLIILIVIGVVIFSGDSGTLDVLRMAWHRGGLVFIPLLLSLAERAAVLWTMPNRSRIEKMAARALISNRIITGLGLFGLMTIAMLIGVAAPSLYDWNTLGNWPVFTAGALYFAIAAYDDIRVRGRKFAENPRVLFRYDALGVKYLEPV